MRWWLALTMAGLLMVGACGGGADPASESGRAARTPVVVDTDMSTDDIVALLYLASRPDVDLRAVVVAGTGLTRCPIGAANAAALLAAIDREDVPVACGLREPQAGANAYPASWRDRADAMFGLELPAAGTVTSGDGIELLRRAISEPPPRVVVLSLAPMTDIAALLERRPAAAEEVARIVAMGGALNVPGNVGPGHEHSEYNVWVDPAAARDVLGSGAPLTLVPLDATNDVPATLTVGDVLASQQATAAAATVARSLFETAGVARGGQYFWDELAAAAIVRPELLSFRNTAVDVEVRGRDAGRTVERGAEPRHRVAVGARREAFERDLLTTLLGSAPTVTRPARTPATVTFDGLSCTFAGPRAVRTGDVTVTSVNRGPETFRLVVAGLDAGHTVGDLAAFLRQKDRLEAPPWLTLEWAGETPPNSQMTWVISLSSPGSKVVGCTVGETRAIIAASLHATEMP